MKFWSHVKPNGQFPAGLQGYDRLLDSHRGNEPQHSNHGLPWKHFGLTNVFGNADAEIGPFSNFVAVTTAITNIANQIGTPNIVAATISGFLKTRIIVFGRMTHQTIFSRNVDALRRVGCCTTILLFVTNHFQAFVVGTARDMPLPKAMVLRYGQFT
jgi:hypothetical protein